MIPILILAAGLSSRMRGTDKLAETVDGIPLHRAQALKAIDAGGKVFVALPDADHPRAALVRDLQVTVVPVPDAGLGMWASLRAGAAALPAADRFMVMLADMPELTADDLRKVLQAPAEAPGALLWRGASEDGGHTGHPALADSSLLPGLLALTGDPEKGPLLRAPKGRTYLVRLPGEHAIRDLDTPEDWAAWRAKTGR